MDFTRRTLMLAPLLAASGCVRLKVPLAPCPDDPSRNGPVNWPPDVGHPVLWGEEHLTPADGVPMPMSIYYPSARVLPPRPMLRQCAWRFPLVLFLHGQSPNHDMQGYHRRWWRIPVTLARSGYVVVVPSYAPYTETGPEAVQPAVDWLLTQWEGAPWLSPAPRAVIGHSYGALVAARYAAAHPEIEAYASLGGVFSESLTALAMARDLARPAFFMFVAGNSFEDFRDQMFRKRNAATYMCGYAGEHFDYLDPGTPGDDHRGPCSYIPALSADLVALFMGREVFSLTGVAASLAVPMVPQTEAQEAMRGIPFLVTQGQIRGQKDCDVALEWNDHGEAGSRQIAP